MAGYFTQDFTVVPSDCRVEGADPSGQHILRHLLVNAVEGRGCLQGHLQPSYYHILVSGADNCGKERKAQVVAVFI